MILVTRLNGSPFAVNPDLLERVEPTPDTVLTLIDGTKYIVTESVTEVISLVREFRASVVVAARAVPREGLDEAAGPDPEPGPAPVTELHPHPHLHVAPEPDDRSTDGTDSARADGADEPVDTADAELAGSTLADEADPVTVGG